MKPFAACALALAIAAPVAAQATPAEQLTTSVAVSQRGLDLTRRHDARVMLRRLDQAALSVCGASHFSVREYQEAVRRTSCYQDGMGQALADVNAPLVTSLYAARMPLAVAARD